MSLNSPFSKLEIEKFKFGRRFAKARVLGKVQELKTFMIIPAKIFSREKNVINFSPQRIAQK
jgi:hypothetical protein